MIHENAIGMYNFINDPCMMNERKIGTYSRCEITFQHSARCAVRVNITSQRKG